MLWYHCDLAGALQFLQNDAYPAKAQIRLRFRKYDILLRAVWIAKDT